MIVAVGGRPWTGKTTLAQALAKAIPAVLLDKAALRRVLFPLPVAPSPEQSDRLYEFLLQATVWHLETSPGATVVLDGRPLTRPREVRALRRFAAGIGEALHIVECVCPDEVARGRAQTSAERPAECSGELAASVPGPKIVVDTLLSPEECLQAALQGIGGVDGEGPQSRRRGPRLWAGRGG